jgi:hypothetical protein
MKQFRGISMLFFAALAIFTSCTSNEEKAGTDTTTATTTTPSVQSTVSTTPQNLMVARHKVADFAKWKASYDAHDSLRQVNGLHNYVIGRGINDSNTVLVAVTADDMNKAKAFSKDASLKQAMQKGGVQGQPRFMFLTMVYRDSAMVSSDIRSMVSLTVKDWEVWRRSFEGGRQLRIDNGLSDRAFGHDADDDHKVVAVMAVNDTAKARAFWNSDQLKQKRAEGGVVGQPDRFVFRVVQRY